MRIRFGLEYSGYYIAFIDPDLIRFALHDIIIPEPWQHGRILY